MVGIILMICGVGMFAALSGLLATVFLGARHDPSSDTKLRMIRLEQIQARLEEVDRKRAERASGRRDNAG